MVSLFPESNSYLVVAVALCSLWAGGDRRSRLSTNSQRLRAIALRGLCGGWLEPAEIGLVRCSPPERLMRTPPIIPAEEFGQAALLFDAVGRRTQIDPFVLDGPPRALDEDVIVAAPAPVHADLDPVMRTVAAVWPGRSDTQYFAPAETRAFCISARRVKNHPSKTS